MLAVHHTEEVLIPFPETLKQAPQATECRSTLLLASLDAITHHGHLDRYKRLMAPAALETITSSVAAVWLPLSIATLHYSACDALGLDSQEQLDLGGVVINKIQQTFLGSVLKAVRTTGAIDPWVGLGKFTGIYSRSFQGGGTQFVKVGPKDARVDIAGLSLSHITYFRVAYRGFIRAGAHLFAGRCFVTDVTPRGSKDGLSFRIAWV